MRELSLHICMLGICCARLPRQAPGTAGRRAEEGGAVRSSRGGAVRGRVGSEERGVPECCGVLLHVTKFGLSRDPSFVASFQLEFTSMLSRTPPPVPPPSLSLPSRSAHAYSPSRAPAPLPRLTGQPLAPTSASMRCEATRCGVT